MTNLALRRAIERALCATALVGALQLASAPAVHAHAAGITSDQFPNLASGCNSAPACHDGGKVPTVVLSGPTLVAPNSTNTYSLTISSHDTKKQTKGGLNVSADAGDFASGGPDTQTMLNFFTQREELRNVPHRSLRRVRWRLSLSIGRLQPTSPA